MRTQALVSTLYRTPLLRAPVPLLGLPLLLVAFAMLQGSDDLPLRTFFLDFGNFRFIAMQSVVVAIGAFGMTLVIASRGIDLSGGAQILFYAALTGVLATSSLWLGVALSLGLGLLLGGAIGWAISRSGAPAWLVTLAAMACYLGLLRTLQPPPPGTVHPWMAVYPSPWWIGVAPGAWLMLFLAVALAFIVRQSVWGRHLLAIGADEEGARLCGVRVTPTRSLVYAVAGGLFALAGVMQMAAGSGNDPHRMAWLEIDMIAAVLLGGTPVNGGRASLFGTLLGAFFLAVLRNGVWQAGWPPAIAELAIGFSILLAIAWEHHRRHHQYAPPMTGWLER